MADRTCPKCLHVYRYPNMLKHHFENTYHCKQTKEYITDFFITNKNINVTEYIYQCAKCVKVFNNIKSLNRHLKETLCSKNQTASTQAIQATSSILEALTPEQLKQISKIINKKLTKSEISNISNIANTDNTTNTTNNMINSNNVTNNTINNNTIIQHINPFGFEDVRTIPISEMKMILNSGTEAGIHIIKTIYNKIENKNFYKPNISRSEIACLNNEFKLTIYKGKEFCDALFDRCIAFLHHMLFLCKQEFTKNSIKYIYDNIEYIETTMRTEIYDKKLQNIIETEFRNNNIDTKDRIKNFIKQTKIETDIKDNSILQIKNTLELKEETNNELKKSIKNEEINKLFGDPKVILGLKKEEIILNLRISRFEESMFYNFWKDRIKIIKNYIMTHKKSTIGDIINLTKEESKINAMLDIIKTRVENIRGYEYIDLNINEEFKLNDFEIQDEYDDDDVYDINNNISRHTDLLELNTFENLVSM